jgi:thiazole synthase
MEMGCDGVLINSAIANAKNPILMAQAFKNAVISGRESFLAGRMKKNYFATPSSPTKGLI